MLSCGRGGHVILPTSSLSGKCKLCLSMKQWQPEKKERLFYKSFLKRSKNECIVWPQWGKALKWINRSISRQLRWGWWSTSIVFETVCVGSRTSLWSFLMLLSNIVGFNWKPNKPTSPIPIYVCVCALHALFWMFSEEFGWLRNWDFWIVRRTPRG